MKFYGSVVLTLCAFQSGASAFRPINIRSRAATRGNPLLFMSTPPFSSGPGQQRDPYAAAGPVGAPPPPMGASQVVQQQVTAPVVGSRAPPVPSAPVPGTPDLNARLANLEASTASKEAQAKKFFETSAPIKVQGGSLKTWSFASPFVERVQVVLNTSGRPLDADVELWQGPDNTPVKMRVYVEDGNLRPFKAAIETPRSPSTVAIRNTANMEFPINAAVVADTIEAGTAGPMTVVNSSDMASMPNIIQGGAIRTYPFDATVDSVQILIKTDGRPLNARIELLQGPNNNKQVVELYTEDGTERPFFAVIECPGSGNVVRVVNTATVEYPMTCWVEPYAVRTRPGGFQPIMGGDNTPIVPSSW